MKCFIKSLLGQDSYEQTSNDVCTPLPPIVKSLVGSTILVVAMVVLSHALRI